MNEFDESYRRVRTIENREGWLSRSKPALELIGVIFVFILAAFTVWQWRDLRQALKVEERSWIKLGIAWPTQPASGSPVSASGQITNIGRSPATDLSAQGVLLIVPSDQSVGSQPLLKGNSINTRLLFPNDPAPLQFSIQDSQTHLPRNFTSDEASNLLAGKAYLAVLGTVEYSDQFGEHWEQFCRWQGYSAGASYDSADCTNWNRVGDGKLPDQ